MVDDQQLLRDFVKDGSETAFTELVTRHVNLVYSAALRRTGDEQLANPGGTLAVTNEFEVVYGGDFRALTNPSSTIVIREREAWQHPNGKWFKAYGFADGHSEIHTEPDGDFEPWERPRLPVPPSRNP